MTMREWYDPRKSLVVDAGEGTVTVRCTICDDTKVFPGYVLLADALRWGTDHAMVSARWHGDVRMIER